MMNKRTKKFIGDAIAYAILVVISVGFMLPLLWMVLTALKTYEQNIDFTTFWPSPVTFENFSYGLFEFIPYFRYFFNSVFLVVVGTAATVLSCSLVAYGFARFKPRESTVWFSVLLVTMMLPSQVTMISSYVIWAKLQLVNTYVPLLIGCFFGGSAFYIFLVRQFIRGVPVQIEEAARIDGAGRIRIFFSIVMPLLLPAIATVSIFSFQGIWNDYMGPLIYIKEEDLFTVAQSLTLFQMGQETLWGEMMAAGIVTILPLVIVFAFFQKYFISGISVGGVKG